MARYKLRSGTHAMPDQMLGTDVKIDKPKIYVKDEIIETDLPLDTMFVNKFDKVVEEKVKIVFRDRPMPVEQSSPEPVEEEQAKMPPPLGDDVTKLWPKAKAADLRVLQTEDGHYNVVDASEPNKVLNNKPMKKAEVNPFIRDF